MITAAVEIDARWWERAQERKGVRWHSRFQTRSPYASTGDPMQLDETTAKRQGSRKKNFGGSNGGKKGRECYNCGKLGHFRRDCRSTRKKETLAVLDAGREHTGMSWTACYEDDCPVHSSDKYGAGWWPKRPRRSRARGHSTCTAPEEDKTINTQSTATLCASEVEYPEIEPADTRGTQEEDDPTWTYLGSDATTTPEGGWSLSESEIAEALKEEKRRNLAASVDSWGGKPEKLARWERLARIRGEISYLRQEASRLSTTDDPRAKLQALMNTPRGMRVEVKWPENTVAIPDGSRITPSGQYIPPEILKEVKRLQARLDSYDPREYPERNVQRSDHWLECWRGEIPPWSQELESKNERLTPRDGGRASS